MVAISFLMVLVFWYLTQKGLIKWLGDDFSESLAFILTPFLFCLLTMSDPWMVFKSGTFICLIYFIGVFDYYTCTIPRFTHYLIGVVGLIGIGQALLSHVLAGFFLGLPLIIMFGITNHFKDEGTGFGDVLYVLSASFFLGPVPGFIGLMVGSILFIVWGLASGKYKCYLPFAPALSIGFFIGLIFMI